MFKRLTMWVLCVFCAVCLPLSLHATEMLSLKGYLGDEETEAALSRVNAWIESPPKEIVLEINSSSGELQAVLLLAQRIYELKQQHPVKILAYLSNSALGPGAILPFVADEIFASPYISWGAIPLGSETSLPLNVLRNRVMSLIDPQSSRAALLELLAEAMVDPSLTVVSGDVWHLEREVSADRRLIVSPKGETLVLSHKHLKDLSLVARFLPPARLHTEFEIEQNDQHIDHLAQRDSVASGTVKERLEAHIAIDETRPLTIGHILIDDRTTGITPGTWLYVKSALDYYKQTKPAFIILELNTPGGQVYAAQMISDALKEMDMQHGIPVVAYIKNWAISAGAMLAYSCRFIAIAPDASMGAAAPVLQGEGGEMVAASEKVNSAIRSDFANRARSFGRNGLLAEAMVDKDLILVKRHGRIVKLDVEEQIRREGIHPDQVIIAQGKLLTLDALELQDFGVSDLLINQTSLPLITAEEETQGLWPAGKEALFHHAYFERFAHGTVDSFQPDWKIDFLAMLTHPMVSSLIFLGLFIGFYMELSSPGFGFPGAVALLCLFLVLLSSFALQAASWLEIILIFAGVILLALEFFVIPGFGVAGLGGIIAIVVGLFALMLPGLENVTFDPDSNTWNAAGEVFLERLVWLCGSLVVGTIIIGLLGRYVLPRFSAFNRLVLQGEEESSQGYVAGYSEADLPPVGSQGLVAATLRPAGKVVIDGRLYDAMSAGAYIEGGTPIHVLRINGGKLIVTAQNSEIETP